MSVHLNRLASLLQQLAANPRDGKSWCQVGFTYLTLCEIQEALDTFISAQQIAPQLADAHYGESIARCQLGEIDRALACLGQAMQRAPADQRLFSAYAHLCTAAGRPPATVFAAYLDWGRRFAEPLRPRHRPPARKRNPGERIRIGYVSADFREHALMSFFAPVLQHHDRERFELIAFASGKADQRTAEIRQRFDHWNDIGKLSDSMAADLFRRRAIDILVDLSGHTEGTRLLALARQAAPVQFTWYGYNGTTGTSTIDRRLTDAVMDPPGNEQWSAETLVRLPAFACYAPPAAAPPVAPLPADSRGSITFGALNNPQKLTGPTLTAWATILRQLPDAQLILIGPHAPTSGQPMIDSLRQRLAAHGLPLDRVELLPRQDFPSFLKLGERIDIALEPFPLSGAVTTCHALWSGMIPVTLAGTLSTTRAAAAILHAANLPHLVADSVDDYVALACRLAHERDHLRQLRAGMRDQLAGSPLLDHASHVRTLENAYLSALAPCPAPP